MLGVLNVRIEKIFLALFTETARRKKPFIKKNKIPKAIKFKLYFIKKMNDFFFPQEIKD